VVLVEQLPEHLVLILFLALYLATGGGAGSSNSGTGGASMVDQEAVQKVVVAILLLAEGRGISGQGNSGGKSLGLVQSIQ
jgi:hypothetical protein